MDARNLLFLGNAYDYIFNTYMLELVPAGEILNVLREFWRVLKPGGTCVILTYSAGGRVFDFFLRLVYRRWPLIVGERRFGEVCTNLEQAGFRIDYLTLIKDKGLTSQLVRGVK